MKFLHAADIHLDSPLRGLERYEGAPVAEIRAATRRAFDALVAVAVEEAVDFLLLAGDLYDGDWRDYNTGLFFADRMVHLAEADIPVFGVAGNHDAASQITKRLRLPSNVRMFSTRRPESALLEDLGAVVHGQGFATRAVTEDLTQGFPPAIPGMFNIGLLHTCLDGRLGHDPYAPCSVEGLRAKRYDYWALGHVHRRIEVSRDPWIVFPGNIQGRHIRESGPKGATLVTVDGGRVTAVEHRDLDVVRWLECRVDAEGCITADEVYERVRDALEEGLDQAGDRTVAARLRIQGRCEAHRELHAQRERWENEFRALAGCVGFDRLWLEKVEIGTCAAVGADAEGNRDDALGGLVRSIRALELDESELADQFSDLRRKLPPEYFFFAGEVADPVAAETLRGTLDDVKELLLARLLGDGEAS